MSVLTTSMLVTEDSEEVILINTQKFEQVTCIRYLIAFPGSVTQDGSALDLVLVLFNSSSEVNIIHPAFAKKLGLVMQTTNVGT